MKHTPCNSCGRKKVEGQWWYLSKDYDPRGEITGYVCPNCFSVAEERNTLLKQIMREIDENKNRTV